MGNAGARLCAVAGRWAVSALLTERRFQVATTSTFFGLGAFRGGPVGRGRGYRCTIFAFGRVFFCLVLQPFQVVLGQYDRPSLVPETDRPPQPAIATVKKPTITRKTRGNRSSMFQPTFRKLDAACHPVRSLLGCFDSRAPISIHGP